MPFFHLLFRCSFSFLFSSSAAHFGPLRLLHRFPLPLFAIFGTFRRRRRRRRRRALAKFRRALFLVRLLSLALVFFFFFALQSPGLPLCPHLLLPLPPPALVPLLAVVGARGAQLQVTEEEEDQPSSKSSNREAAKEPRNGSF